MSGTLYAREIERSLHYLPAWPPNALVRLGDVGTLQRGVRFSHVSTLEDQHIDFVEDEPSPPGQYEHSTHGAVDVRFKAAGEAPVPQAALGRAQAGATLRFSRENAVYFKASGAVVRRVRDIEALKQQVLERVREGTWDRDWVVVVEVVEADSTTVLISSERGASVDISASAHAGPGPVDLADADAGLALARSSGVSTQVLCLRGAYPLLRALRVERTWFGRLTAATEAVEAAPGEELFEEVLVEDERSPEELLVEAMIEVEPDLVPAIERGWDPAGDLMGEIAENYRLCPIDAEQKTYFKFCWDLVKNLARGGLEDDTLHALKQRSLRMVDAACDHLAVAMKGPGHSAGVLGHDRVERRPLSDKYVVFSDHHITHSGHRQEFFSRNQAVYVHALGEYHREGFTLVENGDVEELLIWDPFDRDFHSYREERLDLGLLDRPLDAGIPEELLEQRLVLRYRLLERILDDPMLEPYREAVRQFSRAGRFVRVAGNHDYNLQGEAFLTRWKQAFPGAEDVYDYLLLHDDNGKVEVAILHGHQFDLTTNPAVAPRFGETFSECMAIWFQGGDRTWLWKHDGPAEWATGKRLFHNWLTEDHHDDLDDEEQAKGPPSGPTDDLPHGFDHLGGSAADFAALREKVRERLLLVDIDEGVPVPVEAVERAPRDRGKLLERIGSRGLTRFLETDVFGHSVGWEHFDNVDDEKKNTLGAIVNEVYRGVKVQGTLPGRPECPGFEPDGRHRRFFKYRHTNEQEVAKQLMVRFTDEDRPTIILGHTHEPRWNSRVPRELVRGLRRDARLNDRRARRADSAEERRRLETLAGIQRRSADRLEEDQRFGNYVNSAAAGRFERLVFAVEIVDGQSTMVTWAEVEDGVFERRVWDLENDPPDKRPFDLWKLRATGDDGPIS